MAKRRYDPNGPHPFGFTLDDVPIFVNLTMLTKRRVFVADPDEGTVKQDLDEESSDVFAKWGGFMEKYKLFMYQKVTNGFPVLLTEKGSHDIVNIPMGSKDASEYVECTPGHIRKKLEQGKVKFVTKDGSRVFYIFPDHVTVDFFYNAVMMEKKAKEQRRLDNAGTIT